MKLITERNLLYAYTPMDIHNPHKSKLTLPHTDEVIGTTVSGQTWGAEEYMIIDVISDIIRIVMYGNRRPKATEINNNLKLLYAKGKFDREEKRALVEFPMHKLPAISYARIVTRYPFIRKYGPKKFYKIVEKVSNIRLICEYRYKVVETTYVADKAGEKYREKKEVLKYHYRPKISENIFAFDYSQEGLTYSFRFGAGLSVLFCNNIVAAEWEWLPFEFYSLSKNAQNLYRKYLLVKKRGTEVRIDVARMARTLKLTTPNQTAQRKALGRYLEELADQGFIRYKVERGYRQFEIAMEKLVSN